MPMRPTDRRRRAIGWGGRIAAVTLLAAGALLASVIPATAQTRADPGQSLVGKGGRPVGIGGFYGAIGGEDDAPPRWRRSATPLALDPPIACTAGRDCVIAGYVDRTPGAAADDYRCGSLAVNGSARTLFWLRSRAVMAQGIAVWAAAAGQVIAAGDGNPDRPTWRRAGVARLNPDPGNHVIIDHGDGWQTEYHNLRRNSLTVRSGDKVTAGQTLGQVGLSGDAAYPQLGFKVTLDRMPVDPFIGLDDPPPCGSPSRRGLWRASAWAALRYVPSTVLTAGFADRAPRDIATLPMIETRPPAGPRAPILFWLHVHGIQIGDREQIQLIGPDGKRLRRTRFIFPRNRESWVSIIAMNPPKSGWKPGTYIGRYQLFRIEGDSRMTMKPLLDHDARLRIQ